MEDLVEVKGLPALKALTKHPFISLAPEYLTMYP